VIRAHQPGSEPIDIPETIPNPVVVPKPTRTPTEPTPKEPVRIPEKIPWNGVQIAGEIVANFDGRFITYGLGELDTLVPAYATAIHKSQDSQYPVVTLRSRARQPPTR
jgi:hypothetical protein